MQHFKISVKHKKTLELSVDISSVYDV